MSNTPPEDTAVLLKNSQFLVSRLTPSQPGALGIVGISGDRACSVLDAYFHPFKDTSIDLLEVDSIAVGQWNHELLSGGEGIGLSSKRVSQRLECIVLVRTGVHRWEIHSHGGSAVVRSLINSFVSAGADEVSWDAWLACEKKDSKQTGIRKQLAQVDGWHAAQILTRQISGSFQKDIRQVQQVLDTRPRCQDQLAMAKAVIHRLERASRVGLRLTQPWRVVLLGPVNAGKSSLINALAGYDRSIVSPHAGTTRDVLEARVVIDGWSFDFIDTAGFHLVGNQKKELSDIERRGISRAVVEASNADLMLQIHPLDQSPVDVSLIQDFGDDLPQCINVGTKLDISCNKDFYKKASPETLVRTSSRTGQGIGHLMQVVLETLVPEIKSNPDCLLGGVPVSPEDIKVVRKLYKKIEDYSRAL